MQKKELGIILKRFLPNKKKLSVLSAEKGKIEIVTTPIDKCNQLWPGMIILFSINANPAKIFFVQNTEIIFVPQYEDMSDMHWIHKLLELCYYFSPLDKPATQVFKHMIYCLKYPIIKNHFKNQLPIIKKIYLIKLLDLFGFHPKQNISTYLKLYDQISCMYIDFANKHKVEFLQRNLNKVTPNEIEKINTWILSCIASHQNFRSFKTIFFKEGII